nr:rhodanese-like domain-containing protein [uncultured Friedmanniella sp.]
MISHEVPTISAGDVGPLRTQGWQVLDVRTDEEWASGHIPGSLHVPMDQVVGRLDEIGNRTVVVCAVGGRSAMVTQYLRRQGREALNLEGGVHGWAAGGGPIEA